MGSCACWWWAESEDPARVLELISTNPGGKEAAQSGQDKRGGRIGGDLPPLLFHFFFQAEDGIRDYKVTGVQTCALPISEGAGVRGGGVARPGRVRRRRGVSRARPSRADRSQRLAELRALPRGGGAGDRRLHHAPLRPSESPVTHTLRNIRLPGPKSQAQFEAEARYPAPRTHSAALFSRLCIDRGEGAVLYDADGNSYIDLLAGVGVASLGYAHPKYVTGLQRQIARDRKSTRLNSSHLVISY